MNQASLLFRASALVAIVPLLSGCAAAALAVPLMTATGILTQKKRTRAEVVAALPAANAAALAVPVETTAATAGTVVQLSGLRELPPPSGPAAQAAGPWQEFSAYALRRAAGLTADGAAVSALLTAESALTFDRRMRPCRAREPAVVIDLDEGNAPFSAVSAGPAPPGVAATVARLRDAGVIVLWVSQTSANEVAGVAGALRASGLDPTGRDPILLVRNSDERKQVLREEANETVCVVAMAGDRRSDFDELFDYLRDPTLATAYDAQLGSGWFLVPPLFETVETEPASGATPAGEDGGR